MLWAPVSLISVFSVCATDPQCGAGPRKEDDILPGRRLPLFLSLQCNRVLFWSAWTRQHEEGVLFHSYHPTSPLLCVRPPTPHPLCNHPLAFAQNMDETVSKLRHDMSVVVSQRESLQAALTEAVEGRRKAEERIKALAGECSLWSGGNLCVFVPRLLMSVPLSRALLSCAPLLHSSASILCVTPLRHSSAALLCCAPLLR